jgi:hypothetical protein
MEEIRAVERHGGTVMGCDDRGSDGKDEDDFSDLSSSGGSRASDDELQGFDESGDGGGDSDRMSTWISPYLRRRRRDGKQAKKSGGEGGDSVNRSTRVPLDMSKKTKRQQKMLVTTEEMELLDPFSNQLLFLGANENTNVMAVMLLEQRGYRVRTVANFQELAQLSAKEGTKELAYSIDLVVVDLNAMRLSVELVMRMLGGKEMLGEQLSSRDVSAVISYFFFFLFVFFCV